MIDLYLKKAFSTVVCPQYSSEPWTGPIKGIGSDIYAASLQTYR
jgi:hypothetical protein